MSTDGKQSGALLGLSRSSWTIDELWGGQIRQFVLYGAISVAALALDYGLLIFLTEYVGIYYLVSASISFGAGMMLVYVTSISFIFNERRLASKSLEFTSFAAIGIAGLVLNGVLLWCITTGTPLSYQLAKVPTAGIVFLFNYFARRNLLFSARSWL
jgi:putative flippase GtrA